MEPNKFRDTMIVDFNMLFDTDLGCALYLRSNSSNRHAFEDSIFEASIDYFKYMALCRQDENPIAYMFKKEYKGNADTIYGQLRTEKWDKIIEFSPITDILKVMMMGIDGGYHITINCLNDAEENKVINTFTRFKTVINEEDVSKYHFLYMHYIGDLITRKWDPSEKVVYLYDWSLNHLKFDDVSDTSINPIGLPYMKSTLFNFITPYKDFKMPKG